MLFVIPVKKSLAESTTVLDAPKAIPELRPILEGAELTLGIRIVVRDVRPTMRLGNAQIGELQSYRFGPHRRATVRMERELTRLDALFFAALFDQSLGQLRAFTIRDHPAGNVAAEHVEEHVHAEGAIMPSEGVLALRHADLRSSRSA